MTQEQVNRILTLREVWAEYQRFRNLKPNTVKGYRNCIQRWFPDWLDCDITTITAALVEDRFQTIGKSAHATANLCMRILRALFTFAAVRHEAVSTNPVRCLSEMRSWYKVPRRKRFIGIQHMQAWFRTVLDCEDRNNRDLHLILMLCGLRKNEGSQLKWADVDFISDTITIQKTKNGDQLQLPMTTYVKQILERRRAHKKADLTYVFRGRWKGKAVSEDYRGYLTIAEDSGVAFHFHDLRRTFATVADDLEIPVPTIKRLLNHRTNDVTFGYFCNSVERLRKPMQAINDEMLRRAGLAGLPLPATPAAVQWEQTRPIGLELLESSPAKNARAQINHVDQLLIEAKIIQVLKAAGTGVRKDFYKKLGAQFVVNTREMARILNEMTERGLIELCRIDTGRRCYRYKIAL